MKRSLLNLVAIAATLAASLSAHAQEKVTLRIGHFPNITHVQALVANALTRQGKGFFEQRGSPEMSPSSGTLANAGPSAMEGILAGDRRHDLRRSQPYHQCLRLVRRTRKSASSPARPMAAAPW